MQLVKVFALVAPLLALLISVTEATPIERRQSCATQWAQCGGIGWTGATCCTAGLTCQVLNPYYYQCLTPSGSTTTTTTTTTTRTTTTTTTTRPPTTTTTTTTTRPPTTTTTTTRPPTTTTTTTTRPSTTTTTTTTTRPPTTTTTTTTTTTRASTTTTTTTTTSAVVSPSPSVPDVVIYKGGSGFASGWENWSWSVTFTFGYTGPPTVPSTLGTSAFQAVSTGYGGISWKLSTGNFVTAKTLVLYISGTDNNWGFSMEDTATTGSSFTLKNAAASCVGTISSGSFIPCYVDLTSAPTGPSYNRITMNSGNSGSATIVVANVFLSPKTVFQLTDTKSFSGGAALGSNTLLVLGTGDPTTVKLTRSGTSVALSSYTKVDAPVPAYYFNAASSWVAGSYSITHGNGSFSFIIPAFVTTSLTGATSLAIDSRIYGVNFPPSVKYLQDANIPFGRWGGNLMTTYNPDNYYVNSAADWYFENRISEGGLPAFINQLVVAGGAKAVVSVPELDWVAQGKAPCFSYSVAKYGAQQKVDPYNADAGNGILTSNGSRIVNDPNDCYTPWNPTKLTAWLNSMPAADKNNVAIWTLGNEVDIADGTHVDIQPTKMSYDSELNIMVRTAKAIRAAIPNAVIAGPTSCCSYFWWNSGAGASDQAAKGGVSKIRWLLRQLKAQETSSGIKMLNILDLHFNPDTGTTGDGSATDNAMRLSSTRNWWDPTFTTYGYEKDPSTWAGEPDAGKFQWIRRFKKLIADEYPGLGLGATEWYGNTDLVGGLQIADTLGIFAREGLTFANRWYGNDYDTPGYAGFWLYLGSSGSAKSPFLGNLLNVPIFFNPDVAGVYFASDSAGKKGAVFVNKDPTNYQAWKVTGLTAGSYTIRHFGRPNPAATEGSRMTSTITVDSTGSVVLPPYSAVFIGQL